MGLQRSALRLAGDLIPRMQRRLIDQRSEERHGGIVQRAAIMFRSQEYIVPVINISSRGTPPPSDEITAELRSKPKFFASPTAATSRAVPALSSLI